MCRSYCTSAQQPDKDLLRTGFEGGQLTALKLQGGPALQRQKNEKVGQLDRPDFIIIFNWWQMKHKMLTSRPKLLLALWWQCKLRCGKPISMSTQSVFFLASSSFSLFCFYSELEHFPPFPWFSSHNTYLISSITYPESPRDVKTCTSQTDNMLNKLNVTVPSTSAFSPIKALTGHTSASRGRPSDWLLCSRRCVLVFTIT